MVKEKREDDATIKERVVTFLRRREGDHITTAEVATGLGVTRDQATSALHNLAKRSLPEAVSRVGDGVWVYVSPRTRRSQEMTQAQLADAGRGLTLYLLGRMRNGEVMVAADDDGNMYEVRRLDAVE